MKKNLFWILLCVIIGLFMGTYMFSKYNIEDIAQASTGASEDKKIYVFQYGVYSKKENMIKNLKNIKHVYEELDNKYYVYIGMTTSESNKDKLKEYFNKKSYNIYIKEIEVVSNFYDNLSQYDLLLNEAVSNESINTILETMLAKFEELAIDDKNKRITNQ